MVKPVIVKRQVKGTPLTYSELDTNFQNLDDATITLIAGGTSVIMDLNGSTTISSDSLRIAGNNTTKTVTITGGKFFSATTVSASTWQPNFKDGNVQTVTITSATFSLLAPSNMVAGDQLIILATVNAAVFPADVAFTGIIVNTNTANQYFETDTTIQFISGTGTFQIMIIYDGSSYWGTVNTNYV